MDRETWHKLLDLFDAALAVPAGERPAFLDRACAGRPELRAELDALLAAHDAEPGDARLASPAHHLPPDLAADLAGPEHRPAPDLGGQRVGAYELRDLIGRGGMADVYRAVRADAQYEREVAIKLMKSDLRLEDVERRFRLERQILARLEHPHIATLLDGGVTADGRPYLVMPYVQGRPITAYADHAGLGVRDRVALLRTVCAAVQFAHANLVVHRDLKPSNILVTDQGEVRLLDFGIAKLLDPTSLEMTMAMTGDGRLLTPEYAAPEQVRGEPVTTATDVHALGVLLYELLTGVRPYQGDTLLSLQRAVCDQEVPRPSTRTAQPLDADLEAIVMMALRKEPQRRYASAGQLGDDLGHYLAAQPVTARSDTVGYRLQKFLRRNRVAVTAAVVITVALMGATVFSASQATARARALAVAEAERGRAEELNAFLVDIFRESEPGGGGEVTARQLLDAGALRLGFALDTHPQVQAAMAQAIGEAYTALGLYDQADTLLARAIDTHHRLLPSDHPDLAASWQALGTLRLAQGRFGEADTAYAAAQSVLQAAGTLDMTALADLFHARANLDLQRGELDRARSWLDRALALLTDPDHEVRDHPRLASIWRGFGRLASDQKRWDEALVHHRQALALWPDSLAHRHPRYFDLLESVALALSNVGEVDSALALHRETLAGRQRILGPDHPTVAYSLHNLGRTLAQRGDHTGAVAHYEQAIALRETSLGHDHPAVAHVLESLAIATAIGGDLPGSEPLFLRAHAIYDRVLGPGHPETIESMVNLALLCTALERPAATLDWLERAAAAGWSDLAVLEESYAHLAGDPRYEGLLDRVREQTRQAGAGSDG
jgi:eukaryotic-like serine/threonine-protein kinase